MNERQKEGGGREREDSIVNIKVLWSGKEKYNESKTG